MRVSSGPRFGPATRRIVRRMQLIGCRDRDRLVEPIEHTLVETTHRANLAVLLGALCWSHSNSAAKPASASHLPRKPHHQTRDWAKAAYNIVRWTESRATEVNL